MAKNAKLKRENKSTYLPTFCGSCLEYSPKVIKLASEEMSVPTPPIFTPMSKGAKSVVNYESKIADGTLLITWQERVETSNGLFSISEPNKVCTALILAIFPAKIKKATKVKSKG